MAWPGCRCSRRTTPDEHAVQHAQARPASAGWLGMLRTDWDLRGTQHVSTTVEIPPHVAIQTPSLFAYAASGGRWLPRRHLSLIDELFVRALNEQGFGIVETAPRHRTREI